MKPKKYFITFSNKNFLSQSRRAIIMAKFLGKFDFVESFSKSDIDESFYNENKKILDQVRGAGYWLWKPYFINKVLSNLNFGDYLFYCDSGVVFLKNIDNLIFELENIGQDIMGFELPLIEEQWSKKELFINLNCENDESMLMSNQIMASFILIKKSEFSVNFFSELMDLSKNVINITDIQTIKQSELLIEHRHDQSIFSILYKKKHLIPFKDPSQYGEMPQLYLGKKDIHFKYNNLDKAGIYLFRINKYQAKYSNVLFHYRKSNLYKSLSVYFFKKILNFNKKC